MKCTRCPAPAFLRIDNRTVLCADCWNQVEARFIADLENPDPSGISLKVLPDGAVSVSPSAPANALTAINSVVPASGTRTAGAVIPSQGAAPAVTFPDMPEFLKRVRAA